MDFFVVSAYVMNMISVALSSCIFGAIDLCVSVCVCALRQLLYVWTVIQRFFHSWYYTRKFHSIFRPVDRISFWRVFIPLKICLTNGAVLELSLPHLKYGPVQIQSRNF